MKVLLVKTSSMGDVVHTLPAVTDAAKAFPGISFDWVVESAFQDIPLMHPNVNRVIPVSVRKWRKNIFKHLPEIRAGLRDIKDQQYDLVIDAQGLIKSAFLTHYGKGVKYGLSTSSCREPLAAMAYEHKIDVPKGQHAIERVRQLFAQSIGYSFVSEDLSYGLKKEGSAIPISLESPYLVFLHGTTWASKHWPSEYWQELISLVTKNGFNVYLPWGNEEEKIRAGMLSGVSDKAKVLQKSTIKQLSSILMHADGVVGVDSGLAHLAAACGTPAVTLYGSTNSVLTGTLGENNSCLQADFPCSPCLKVDCSFSQPSEVHPACYQTLSAEKVWQKLQLLMS